MCAFLLLRMFFPFSSVRLFFKSLLLFFILLLLGSVLSLAGAATC
jgi:hypothetical protein